MIEEGEGELIFSGDEVKIYYSATLTSGKISKSNLGDAEPYKFMLG